MNLNANYDDVDRDDYDDFENEKDAECNTKNNKYLETSHEEYDLTIPSNKHQIDVKILKISWLLNIF